VEAAVTLDYVLFDMDTVRREGLLEHALDVGREKVNDDDVTSFTWVTLAELAQSGAVLDMDLQLPPKLAMATPAWYKRKCDAMSKAVWRGQLTEREASFELEFWHKVCWRLPWPTGWANGRIRTAK
jgi:hypothetical protein